MTNHEDLPVQLWKIGHRPSPLEFLVTPELNDQYLFAVQDFHPRYVGPDAVVHPALLLSLSNSPKSPSYQLLPDSGGMVAQEITEMHSAGRVGESFRVEWELTEQYQKRDRLYNVIETVVTEVSSRRRVMTREIHETYTRYE